MPVMTNEQMVSYGMGWQFGRHLLTHNYDGLDLDAALKGVTDCFHGNQSPITDQQVEVAFKAIAAKVEAHHQKLAREQAVAGQAYMAANARKSDVSVTPSGLQYRILEQGDGPHPGPLDLVRVHYHGMLVNGDVFDSSIERGQPVEFGVQEVIPGWTEALQMLTVGSKCRLFIPPELAYGPAGKQPLVPGNAALIFDLELLAIV